MESPVRELAHRLGENAEAVCRHYLSNGRREGLYWMVGDKGNAPGRSLYVRLVDGDGRRTAGKWTDAATGDHGDLLDIIAASCAHTNLAETLAEARRFLSLPPSDGGTQGPRPRPRRAPAGSPDAAARLWAASKPIAGTPVRTYLAGRALRHVGDVPALRCQGPRVILGRAAHLARYPCRTAAGPQARAHAARLRPRQERVCLCALRAVL